jgi:hypothetical protein
MSTSPQPSPKEREQDWKDFLHPSPSEMVWGWGFSGYMVLTLIPFSLYLNQKEAYAIKQMPPSYSIELQYDNYIHIY